MTVRDPLNAKPSSYVGHGEAVPFTFFGQLRRVLMALIDRAEGQHGERSIYIDTFRAKTYGTGVAFDTGAEYCVKATANPAQAGEAYVVIDGLPIGSRITRVTMHGQDGATYKWTGALYRHRLKESDTWDTLVSQDSGTTGKKSDVILGVGGDDGLVTASPLRFLVQFYVASADTQRWYGITVNYDHP